MILGLAGFTSEAMCTNVFTPLHVAWQFGNTALMWACDKGYLQVVKALLAAKARTDAKDQVRGGAVSEGTCMW